MDIINKKIYVDTLFEAYGKLLTSMQYEVMTDYCINDLTESEIAENRNVTRQAVHDTVKKSTKILVDYEDKLGFVSKNKWMDELLDQIEAIQTMEEFEKIRKVLKNGDI